MRSSTRFTLALGCLLMAGAAQAEALVGVAAPLSGPSAILGRQVRDGATAAAATLGADAVRLEVADDRCSAEGGAAVARRMVAERVGMVVGFLCTESIEAALPILKEAGIPAITVGVRTDSLTDRRQRTGWPVYRLAPRADGEREAAARLIPRLWRTEPFALVDDGTIYGRELSESIRLAAEQAGLKPVLVEAFRPQLENQTALIGRLKRAGATRAFAGGDREDIAIMARDAATTEGSLQFAGGETLRAATPGDLRLAEGTLMVAPVDWAERADPGVLADFQEQNIPPDGYVLPAYAAVQIAEAALRQGLTQALGGRDFGTAIGSIRFDDKGDLTESPYGLFRYEADRFIPQEVP